MKTKEIQIRATKNWGCVKAGEVFNCRLNKNDMLEIDGLPFATSVPSISKRDLERETIHGSFELVK